jgi:predicted transcriptional regulator
MVEPPDRPDLFVVVRILGVLRESPGGLRKTPLQQAAGVNYTVFSRYLTLLADRGLVRLDRDETTELVVITERGVESLGFLLRGIERVVRPSEGGRTDKNR